MEKETVMFETLCGRPIKFTPERMDQIRNQPARSSAVHSENQDPESVIIG